MEEKKKQVVLIFKRKNLLYSISNYAYIVGHPMPDNTENNKHMIIDICEEGNIDRVNRILSTIWLSSKQPLMSGKISVTTGIITV